MSNYNLVLGNVTFYGFEIPENLDALGGHQVYNKKLFPGGTITIHTIGAFPLPITWRGYLSGANALDRMTVLQRFVTTGQTVELSYGRFRWKVAVVMFDARPRHQYLAPYQIHLEPLQDLSGIGTVPAGVPSAESQISDYNTSLTGLSNGPASTLPDTAGGSE